MTRPFSLGLLPALLATGPVLAQVQPVRIVNGTSLTATAVHMRPVGIEEWGSNLLGRNFLPPGAFLAVQPGEGAGCRFDLRLLLRDGREVRRNNVDVCAQRSVSMALGPAPAPTPEAAGPGEPAPERP